MSAHFNHRVAGCLALTLAMIATGCAEDLSAPRVTNTEGPRYALGPGQIIYIIEDIHPLGGSSSQAWAINNSNKITGWRDWGGVQQGFIRTIHGTAWGLAAASFAPYTSVGFDFNDAGVVVGSASNQAARWAIYSQIQELTHPSKWASAQAIGVNSLGYAVGYRANSQQRFLAGWDPNGIGVDLMSDRGYTLSNGEATDINGACKIVGRTGNRPFQLAAATCLAPGNLVMLQLLPGEIYGGANAINDAGAIVGYSYDATGHWEAVLWSTASTPPAPLGILPGGTRSYANDINENGTIVGTSEISGGKFKGFRRRTGGSLVALPMLQGGVQSTAVDLNDSGHVVGWVEMSDLSTHAVAWWIYQAPHVLEPSMSHPPDPVLPGGLITVDLLSSKPFQPATVDLYTVTLGNDVDEDTRIGGAKTGRPLVSKLELNGDGIADLRISFYAGDVMASGDMKPGSKAELVLKGALRDRSKAIYGTIPVTIK